MNILIINQPTDNRGDEAAHKSLMRELIVSKSNSDSIKVVFVNANPNSVREMEVHSDGVEYLNIPVKYRKFYFRAFRFGMLLNLSTIFSLIHPTFRSVSKLISDADLVICAPGGICMGGFQNWEHVYWLYVAKKMNKKIAYYSRSFGPFNNHGFWSNFFTKISYDLLRYFAFISIRDAKTMQFANDAKISYTPSIDTAFLNDPVIDIPEDVRGTLSSCDYAVFVPNSLTWHTSYSGTNKSKLEDFYLQTFKCIWENFPNINIVMLPQLFNTHHSDELYFKSLKAKMNNDERILIFPETYSSDIQQKIIGNSKFMIGARYHSVVFSINNNVPFIALSYEHKISGLLKILGKDQAMIDIESAATDAFDVNSKLKDLDLKLKSLNSDIHAKNNARSIAKKCYEDFIKFTNRLR